MKKVDALKQKESIAAAVSVAEEKPKKAIKVGGAKSVYNYGEGKVYEVRAGIDRITNLELQAGEVLWEVQYQAIQYDGN